MKCLVTRTRRYFTRRRPRGTNASPAQARVNARRPLSGQPVAKYVQLLQQRAGLHVWRRRQRPGAQERAPDHRRALGFGLSGRRPVPRQLRAPGSQARVGGYPDEKSGVVWEADDGYLLNEDDLYSSLGGCCGLYMDVDLFNRGE